MAELKTIVCDACDQPIPSGTGFRIGLHPSVGEAIAGDFHNRECLRRWLEGAGELP